MIECNKNELKIEDLILTNEKNVSLLKEENEKHMSLLNEQANEALATKEAEIELLNKRCDEINLTLSAVNSQNLIRNNKLAKLQSDLTKKENQCFIMETELSDANYKMNELNLKLNDKLNENAYLTSELSERAKDINGMNAEKNERILETEKLNALIQHRKQEINSLNLRITDLEARIKGKLF